MATYFCVREEAIFVLLLEVFQSLELNLVSSLDKILTFQKLVSSTVGIGCPKKVRIPINRVNHSHINFSLGAIMALSAIKSTYFRRL